MTYTAVRSAEAGSRRVLKMQDMHEGQHVEVKVEDHQIGNSELIHVDPYELAHALAHYVPGLVVPAKPVPVPDKIGSVIVSTYKATITRFSAYSSGHNNWIDGAGTTYTDDEVADLLKLDTWKVRA